MVDIPPRGIAVNPARAGMIPARKPSIKKRVRKPRASGDDPKKYGLDVIVEW